MTTPIASRAAGRRWAVVTAVSGTVFIAAGAFWLSFTALVDLAARSGVGAGQAWAWPLIVDGIIVVATVAVVALAGQKTAWYPWALLIGGAAVSVAANAIHAVVAADADVPGVLAASVAAVPPVVLLAITHLTVLLPRPAPGTVNVTAARAAHAAHRGRASPSGGQERARHVYVRTGTGAQGPGGGPAGRGVVEQADRPRTRCASVHGRPLVRPCAPS